MLLYITKDNEEVFEKGGHMSDIYRKNYEINYYNTDENQKCTVPSIVNFFTDVGTSQSEFLGETLEVLEEKKRAWVFYKYDIKIYNYPKYREKITVETENIGFKKFYDYKRYAMLNLKGEVLAEALALFLFIDVEKRRATRITKDQYDLYNKNGDLDKEIKFDDILKLDEVQYTKEFSIRYSDIDTNGHVNNCKYIEWAIESVPFEIVKNNNIKRIKVIFKKETIYGENISVFTQVINNDENIVTVHQIVDSNGIELTKLEIEWGRE